MGSIRCDKVTCEHNEQIEHYSSKWGICRRGAGYDYGGGDIQINKFGHCISRKRKLKPNP